VIQALKAFPAVVHHTGGCLGDIVVLEVTVTQGVVNVRDDSV
jgi:hypothetical protein